MKKFTLALVAVATLALVGLDSKPAEAAHGYRGFGVHIGGRAFYGHRSWYRAPVHYNWHNTSHWDYHPPEYVPHGYHTDFVPGHLDFHRNGHWDRHRGHRRW